VSDTTRRFARGAGWLYAHRWIERLADFALVVVLARLLSPHDFGLVAIATSFVAVVEGLAAFDVHKALIRTREEHRSLFDTAWTLSLLRGLLSACTMAAIALLLDDQRTRDVLLALAAAPILNGLVNPRFATFERGLVYSRVAAATLGAKAASVAVTLAIAVAFQNYWALVAGVLVGALAATALSYALLPYRPSFTLVRAHELFAFSGWLTLATVTSTLAMETDRLIVGRLVGIADAGLYFMTQRIGVVPTRELISPLQRMMFPSFAELVHDRERLRRGVVESVNVFGSLSLPAGVGFALIAPDVVPVVLGAQWTAITPLVQVLVPYLGVRATLTMAWPCAMALGVVRTLFWVSLVYALVHLPVFVAGTALFGLRGAIWSIVLAGILYTYLNAWLLRRTLAITMREILGQLRRPALATLAMFAAVLLVRAALPSSIAPPPGGWSGVLLTTIVGAAAHLAATWALWRVEGRPPGIEQRVVQVLVR
jgi:PST family polysaccharide transporter